MDQGASVAQMYAIGEDEMGFNFIKRAHENSLNKL